MAKRNTYFQDEVIDRKIDLKQLGRTLRYLLPLKKVFILVLVLMFIASLVSLIPPLVLKEITDRVIPNKDYAQLAYMVLSMIALAVIEISITFLHARLMGKAGHTVIANIRQDITILGVKGTMSSTEGANAQAKEVTPSMVEQVVLPDEGFNYLSQVIVKKIPYVESENSAGGTTVTIG